MQSTLHVAIIMDGNGRWAERLGMPRALGHRAGAEALRRVVEAAPALGVGILTVYAFSSDNWKRPAGEVTALMSLLACYLESEAPRMRADRVRLSVIGRRDRLPAGLVDAIADAETQTRTGRRLWLRLAIDYSARESILRATERGSREQFEEAMRSGPPVDLLIRTGGEQRLSDFMLWESAYAELFFTPRMWPDFDPSDLHKVLDHFRARDRRFGGLPPPSHQVVPRDRWLR